MADKRVPARARAGGPYLRYNTLTNDTAPASAFSSDDFTA